MFALSKYIISLPLFINVFGCPYGPQIIKNIRISNIPKLMIKYAISLILIRVIRVTLKPIDGPVNPIYISLFQIFDQIFPRSIPFIVSKLAQNIRNSITTYKCLRIEHFLSEWIIAECCHWRRPWKWIEMSTIYQFIWNTVL